MTREYKYRRCAFTLVELMVVVVIIGVIATVSTISVRDYLISAKQKVARGEIATIKNALELYFMESDKYPTSDEGLALLKRKTPQHPNGILSNDLEDPWGNPYVYFYPGVHGAYDIVSFGADGQEGGAGADMDITSWDLEGKQE